MVSSGDKPGGASEPSSREQGRHDSKTQSDSEGEAQGEKGVEHVPEQNVDEAGKAPAWVEDPTPSSSGRSLREVKVHGLAMVVPLRLLGEQDWRDIPPKEPGTRSVHAKMEREDAADLAARLRKICLLGHELEVEIRPPLSRSHLRQARLEDSRRRRETTPGFLRKGVKWDEEGRFSLTPEALALQIAKMNGRRPVIDAGCGIGGNAIAFARQGATVLAIEEDPNRAKLARANARIYKVETKLQVRCADAKSEIPAQFAGLVFCDPPWGRDWKQAELRVDDFPLACWLWEKRGEFGALWLKLPPAFDPQIFNIDPNDQNIAIDPVFGLQKGDFRRVKFILIRYEKEPHRLTRLST